MTLPRLPIPVGPARYESLASYLTRLASLHGVPAGELWKLVTTPLSGSQRRRVDGDRLAHITGRRVEHLARALPELQGPDTGWESWRHQTQPGCPRCDARHDGGPVLRLLPHHHYVCTRHRYWIGPPDAGQPATFLGGLPGTAAAEILRAQRQHHHLLARYGHAATFDAVLTGFLICGHLWHSRRFERAGPEPEWVRRVEELIPPGTEDTTYSASRLFAAIYPEAVSLAGLIASPAWRKAAGGDAEQQHAFLAEACRRIGRKADANDRSIDAIRHWMIFDSHHPPSRPEKTFPQTREHGTIRITAPSRASQDRTERSAKWFRVNRRGGSAILRHRHLRPVLAREWATPMDGIEATIHASQSVVDFGASLRRNEGFTSEIAK